ncbi:hypothetical protein [Aliiruegeria lutimaris]|uniref:Uncharacterized protein n=1 Tax=Aliiruegeria lutimaris TaxID=571298 RepID=A0A1G9BAT9_9RHOB|nr:hypothetical protein [Aliiruegeria lutimaris]SDK36628.1 hypothetical protein SAMN04488026_10397 [Aliiruegeria lutimaris]
MYSTSGDRLVLGPTAQNLLRILIASYFLAGAVGLIPGTDLTALTDRFMPAHISSPFGSALVFSLAYLVMIGVWLRGAALTLGILTFWASYLRMMDLGLQSELGIFWRDLALIASLMLTYAEPDRTAARNRGIVRWNRRRVVQPRRITPRRVENAVIEPAAKSKPQKQAHRRDYQNSYEPYEPPYGHDKVSIEELERIFQEDFEIARSS